MGFLVTRLHLQFVANIIIFLNTNMAYRIFYAAPLPATSPAKAPPYHPPASTSLSTSNKGKHSSLILILGLGAGVLFIAITSLLIVCLCMFRQEKPKAPPIETGNFFFPHSNAYYIDKQTSTFKVQISSFSFCNPLIFGNINKFDVIHIFFN